MKRSRLFLGVCLALGTPFTAVPRLALAQDAAAAPAAATASVWLYLFENQAAAPGLDIQVDGRAGARTDAKGSVAFKLPPGAHRVTVARAGETVLEMPLEVAAGEQLQISASLFADRAPVYQLESSIKGKKTVDVAQVATAPVPFTGSVVNAATGAPVADAEILINGQSYRASGVGEFEIPLAPGTYSVFVSAAGFEMATLEGLVIEPKKAAKQLFRLVAGASDASPPTGGEVALEGVTVTGTIQTDDAAAYAEEKRASTNVTESLSNEEIQRAGDTDAAAALKRVTGLTLVDGRYVYVRGLGERYSSVLLNGAQIPSPDPTRRVVPLDLFPTELLEGLVIQKSYSADMPGEFGGGTVQLRTKRFPSSFYAKLAGGIGFSDGTTFEDGLAYHGGDRDYTGRDDGTRDLPDALADFTADGRFLRAQSPLIPDGATPRQIEQFGESLAGVFDVEQESIGPDGSFNAALGNQWELGDDIRAGFLASGRWAQSWDVLEEERNSYVATDAGLEIQDSFELDRTLRNVDTSAFLTSGIELGSNHFLRHTSMLVRQTEDETKVQDGFDTSEQTRITELEWIENSLAAHQLGGEHYFPAAHDLEFTWMYTKSKAERSVPNKRRYRYDYVIGEDGGETLQFSGDADNIAINFEQLDDDGDNLDLKFALPLTLSDEVTLKLSTGGTRFDRERDSSIRRYTYQAPTPGSGIVPDLSSPSLEDILNDDYIGPGGYTLIEQTRATDNYFAEQTVDAYFVNAEFGFSDQFRATIGARRETNEQEVTTFSIASATATPIVAKLDESDVLPALNLTWFASPDSQLRASYSETVSRPDFRELSPAPYTDPVQDAETLGNPDLVTTHIKNYDLRYEYYFSPAESVSAALFLKDFDNPIEILRIPGSGVLLQLDNALEARNYGLELDVRKVLDVFEEGGFAEGLGIGDWLEWSNFYVGANYAYIESEVELDPESSLSQTNQNRPLQGQSPYVSNLQLGYLAPDGGREITVLFNRFGERIAQVGIEGAPDVYEQPFNQLDVTWQEQLWKDWTLKVRLRNLLDPSVEYTQGGETTREYKRGREIGLVLEWEPGED